MKLTSRKGYMQGYDEFVKPLVYWNVGETGEVRDHTPDRNQEWFLEATVRITFWANKAQYHDAARLAETALLHRLYEPVLRELHNMRLAISNGDKREAFAVVDRMAKIAEAAP